MSSFPTTYSAFIWLALFPFSVSSVLADGLRTHHVILITLDGVRVQEVFAGLDETIAVHDQEHSEIETGRQRYGQGGPEQRRSALLPHFWKQLAPQGVVLGNPVYDNHVKVQNRIRWSTPGYIEIQHGSPL